MDTYTISTILGDITVYQLSLLNTLNSNNETLC